MRAIALVFIFGFIFGIGISSGQTDSEESGKLIVTITDENGNLVEVPSVPHVTPIVTDDSPPPPNSSIEPPTDLIINDVQYNE